MQESHYLQLHIVMIHKMQSEFSWFDFQVQIHLAWHYTQVFLLAYQCAIQSFTTTKLSALIVLRLADRW